jgi:hypothetical protein
VRKALSAIAVPLVIVAGLLVGYGLFHPPDYQGPHVVDGYPIGPEDVCPGAPSPDTLCAVAVPVATQSLVSREPAAVVVRASIAVPTCSDTAFVICTTAGLAKPAFVVFDLQDGSRRVIGEACQGPAYSGASNAIVEAPKCMASDLSSYRTH